ncbi:MAG: radical SAM protein [Ruminococcus flavefaciens]|nr:radical SAM protein [Ruminococcus flavefaciens]
MSFVFNSKKNFLEMAKNRKIICFGAGKLFTQFLQQSESWEIDIEYVVDNDVAKQGKTVLYHGREIRIQNPTTMGADKKNYVILITSKAVSEIKNKLLEKELKNPLFVFPFDEVYPDNNEERKRLRLNIPAIKTFDQYCREFNFCEKQKEYWMREIEGKFNAGIVLPYMTTLITTGCTLKCRDCNNLMPFFNRRRFIPKETIIHDINSICGIIDYCICMNITGGEPFLHQELDQLVDAMVTNDKIVFVEIITNGTLIPSRKILKSLKNEKVIVKISEYQGYSRTQELTQLLKNEGIRFLVNDNLTWIASGGIQRRNKEYERIKYEYLSCWSGKFCKSIYDGRVYACARAAFLHEIGASNHPSDYLNIDGGNLKKRFLDFYLQDYVDACDFCDHADLDRKRLVKPAIQCH